MAREKKSRAPGGRKTESGGTGMPASALFNWVTALGVILTGVGISGTVLLMVADAVLTAPPAYLGMFFVPLLLLLVIGIVLIPVGYVLAKRKRARGQALRLPLRVTLDLTIPYHRYVLAGALVVGVAALVVIFTGSFKAYQVMETNAFCGQTCHSVMAPEYTAYQHTSHARVKCVECHIGTGVGYYISSKTTGLRRLVALVTGHYPRPIPTPIRDMRPARETCEECHWSSRLVGYKEQLRTYYGSKEDSPEYKLRMLVKIGGGDSLFMKGFGIHYHMQVANKVEYIARDRQRQEISWVRVTHANGSVVEYSHEEFPLSDEQKKTLPVRRMDCLDCHNRPAHEFKSPMTAVDEALASGKLTRKLPFIKVRAVKALDGKYASTEDAKRGIAAALTAFYTEERPEVMKKQGALVAKTIADLQEIYDRAFFPEMQVKWSAYPNNIGHRDWPGCFRCHSDKMKSATGATVFTDCTKCHLILAQGPEVDRGAPVNFARGVPFKHPGYDDVIKEYNKCIDCHTGGAELY